MAPRSVAVVVLVLLFAAFISRRSNETTSAAEFEGWVYEKCDEGHVTNPVGGMIVSTSLNATTVVTDAEGHFHWFSQSKAFAGDMVIITFRAGTTIRTHRVSNTASLAPGFPTSRQNRTFTLSPPWMVAGELWPACR
jgi:hypothetical protein